MSLLTLVFLGVLAQALAGDTERFTYGMPPAVAWGMTIGSAAALLSLPVAVWAGRQWVQRRGGWAARVRFSIVALSGLTLLGLLYYWNVLGFYLRPQ